MRMMLSPVPTPQRLMGLRPTWNVRGRAAIEIKGRGSATESIIF
jgi:hypothetical protein